MRETSRRPPSLTARRLVLVDGELPADTLFAPADNHRAGLLRPLRVMRRAGLVLLWTLSCAPFQMLFLLLPGRAKVTLPKFYWSRACSLLGLQVRVIGRFATTEELAHFFVFLCSSKASYSVGSSYYVDGGWLRTVT